MSACQGCGTELPQQHGGGRRRKWCGERCRKRTTYAGACVDCGTPTASNGTATPSERCVACTNARNAVLRKARHRVAITAASVPAEVAGVMKVPVSLVGGVPRAYALVDQEDCEALCRLSWRLDGDGYAMSRIDGRSVSMHRLLLDRKPDDGCVVDHINGDALDNRRENLRVVTHAENVRNRRPRTYGTSRYRGVHWSTRRRRWVAKATVDGREIGLGIHVNELDAARAVYAFWHEVEPAALAAGSFPPPPTSDGYADFSWLLATAEMSCPGCGAGEREHCTCTTREAA